MLVKADRREAILSWVCDLTEGSKYFVMRVSVHLDSTENSEDKTEQRSASWKGSGFKKALVDSQSNSTF